MKKQAILFDMDGVIINSEPLFVQIIINALKQHYFYYDEELLKTCIGTSDEYTFNLVQDMTKQQLPQSFYDLIESPKNVDYNDHKMDNIDIVLDTLKSRGYKLALCSSSSLRQIELVLNQINRSHFFDVILSGEQFNETKPHPEIYLTAMDRLNLQPDQCLVVEDSIPGIQAAKNANIEVVGIHHEYYNIDISHADHIIHNMFELLELV